MSKDEKKITDIPFMKAYNFLLNKAGLTSAEKLVMVVVCRFWPNPYWDSNAEVAKALGFTERYAEKIIKSLAEKRIIKRGYAHMDRNGRPHTVRVIVAACFPKIPGHRIKWVEPEQLDGQQPEHMDGCCPNSRPFLTEQPDDLLDESTRGKESTPSPLPAGGQATPCKDKDAGQDPRVARFTRRFGNRPRRRAPGLTPAELEDRKRTQLKALLG